MKINIEITGPLTGVNDEQVVQVEVQDGETSFFYDLPYDTFDLVNDVADALEMYEADKDIDFDE